MALFTALATAGLAAFGITSTFAIAAASFSFESYSECNLENDK